MKKKEIEEIKKDAEEYFNKKLGKNRKYLIMISIADEVKKEKDGKIHLNTHYIRIGNINVESPHFIVNSIIKGFQKGLEDFIGRVE
jgi:hypothetical protein